MLMGLVRGGMGVEGVSSGYIAVQAAHPNLEGRSQEDPHNSISPLLFISFLISLSIHISTPPPANLPLIPTHPAASFRLSSALSKPVTGREALLLKLFTS